MCPSFMVTREEEHSTRGRANALRLALTGQLGPGALTSERMHDVMSLCLMCKACKAECPSNVDVAKLKVEFLAHYYKEHRPGLGTMLLGNAALLNRVGSAVAPLANWMVRAPGVNRVTEWLTGIDHRRKLPEFHSESFPKWFRTHTPDEYAGARGRVVLLDDCLTSYCEPHLNRLAVKLLEGAGYHVELAGLWCCGRPQISKGLIDQGKALARRNVARLVEFVNRGLPILGIEPSCLLTLVDEYPDLFPSDATKKVRDNAFLIDTWMAGRAAAGKLDLQFHDLPQNALLHGHCQQKALVGTQGTRKTLGLIPGLQVREVDSGCCGMAGSFGYEHYDVSLQIGERALFPAARAHQGPVIAPGFSCRHQLSDATGVRALHPVELLAQALKT
jgi:Fe-S oxidoreductase